MYVQCINFVPYRNIFPRKPCNALTFFLMLLIPLKGSRLHQVTNFKVRSPREIDSSNSQPNLTVVTPRFPLITAARKSPQHLYTVL